MHDDNDDFDCVRRECACGHSCHCDEVGSDELCVNCTSDNVELGSHEPND
jgi:hypothetical protein